MGISGSAVYLTWHGWRSTPRPPPPAHPGGWGESVLSARTQHSCHNDTFACVLMDVSRTNSAAQRIH